MYKDEIRNRIKLINMEEEKSKNRNKQRFNSADFLYDKICYVINLIYYYYT